mgnify:CR=1 FL=1
MEKKILTSARTGDSCIHVKHSSGLDIYICEMPGFSSVEALFGTKYGSINTMFRMKDDVEYTVVPEGIAHFLEHKLFENEDCDVFELYAKTGANGNAYTSFDKTCYLFNCSGNYQESLKILLDFPGSGGILFQELHQHIGLDLGRTHAGSFHISDVVVVAVLGANSAAYIRMHRREHHGYISQVRAAGTPSISFVIFLICFPLSFMS